MTTNFLLELQQEAKRQAGLESHKYLPRQLEGLAALMIKYPWQSLLLVSFLSAIFLELL